MERRLNWLKELEQNAKDSIAQIIKNDEKYDRLMRGWAINLDRCELDDYISCQNELGINAIKIQRGSFGYSIRADKPTIIRYLEKKGGVKNDKA